MIHNSTIPVSAGTEANLYSLLTIYYFPAWAGYLLLLAIGALFVYSQLSTRRQWQAYGSEIEDFEIAFLKIFVGL